MTHSSQPLTPAHSDELDFDSFLAERSTDPKFAAAYEDAAKRSRLVRDLVDCRKAHGLRQRQVADHMEVSQSVISEFETSSTDAYFSTLQRYARALGARLRVQIEMPADQTWAAHVRANYSFKISSTSEPTVVRQPTSTWLQSWAAEVVEQREQVVA